MNVALRADAAAPPASSTVALTAGLVAGGAVGLYEMFFGHLFATNNALVWTLPLVTYIFLALMS
ncbi:MAG TPA: polysulfide reductase, partial [Verrucomicrobiota bacterium]|nr:polysulfide reductase [Verrucomicrobiota bacterium]